MGPSTGNTKIVVRGYGFQQLKYNNGTTINQKPQFKFIDQNKKPIGETIQEASEASNNHAVIYSPPAPGDTKATIMISFNGQNW